MRRYFSLTLSLTEPSYLSEFHFLVPTNLGSQRITLDTNSVSKDVITAIHDALGCTNVKIKPIMTYKLTSATAKTPAIRLSSESDWDGVIGEVRAAYAKATKATREVLVTSFDLYVTEQVKYLYLLVHISA